MESSTQFVPVIAVRVIDAAKKSSFKVRRYSNFPVVATVNEFRTALLGAFPDLSSIAQPGFPVGYVLERNKKFVIHSNLELESAYDAVLRGYEVWMDPHSTQAGPSGRAKRKYTKIAS